MVSLAVPDQPPLSTWTVYRFPKDYPGKYVVRRWLCPAGKDPVPTDEVHTEDTLDAARAHIPFDRCRLCRSPSDDPNILETWI